MITAWTLIVWLGAHLGPYAVSGIASREACEELFVQVKAEGFSSGVFAGKDHLCLPYPAAKTQ